jgi:hypothetical protein
MAKTAPWFVHYGCVPGLYPDSAFLLTAFMPKPTQTTLYCRAVMLKHGHSYTSDIFKIRCMKTVLVKILVTVNILAFLPGCASEPTDYEIITLQSLENKKASVKYKFDPNTDRLILELSKKERMCIQNARGLDSVPIIYANKFIQFPVVVRGGSGEAVRNCIVICISKNKLYKSLAFTSLIRNTVDEITYCETNITGLIEKDNTFELHASGRTLKFDLDKKIFFDSYCILNGPFNVNSDKDYSTHEVVYQNEKYPTAFDSYVYIQNKWFAMGSFHLEELTSNCN